jgi:ABC-type branched-subunit amino acid transport system substrate-binding protein
MKQLHQIHAFSAICLALLLTIGCTPAKPTTRPRPNTPTKPGNTGTKPTPGKVDTIKWTNTDPNTRPPVTDGGTKPNSGTKPNTGGTKPNTGSTKPGQTYTIGLLLPFQTAAYKTTTKIPEQSELAFQFYAGAQIALAEVSETLKSNYKIEVADTDLTDDALRNELNKLNYDNWDVIIGPMRSSQVQVVAGRTQTRKKILISPQSVQANLVKNYPEMVQIPVGLENHCRAIGEYVMSKYDKTQIVLVCREREKERLEYFKKLAGWPTTAKILVLPDATASVTTSLKTYLSPTKVTSFIVPSFGSMDFVNGFLTKLRADKGKNEVAVFGMPQWEEFSAIEFDLFDATNTHITRDYFWNPEGEAYLQFQKQFFDQFGAVPDKDAVKGYDVMRWVTSGLDAEGLQFSGSGAQYNGLGYQFKLKSAIGDDGTINYTENVKPRILKFAEVSLNPIDRD